MSFFCQLFKLSGSTTSRGRFSGAEGDFKDLLVMPLTRCSLSYSFLSLFRCPFSLLPKQLRQSPTSRSTTDKEKLS